MRHSYPPPKGECRFLAAWDDTSVRAHGQGLPPDRRPGRLGIVDPIDQQLAASRKLSRVRELGQQPPETALPELRKFLSSAQADAVVRETILRVRAFAAHAAELIPVFEGLAHDHADIGVRSMARVTIKRIRESAEATGDTP